MLEVKARRSKSSSDGPAPDEWDMELAGAALRVQQTLESRAHAFATVPAWVVCTKKFMVLYACKPSDMFRAPTAQEAEAADRLVLEEVFQLCFSGHALDDALTNIVVDMDMLRHVPVERPKILKAEREKAQVRPPPTPSGLSPLPRKTESKRQLGSAGLGHQKRVRNGECWLWVDGKCANRQCRFKHACAVCGDKSHHAAECLARAG